MNATTHLIIVSAGNAAYIQCCLGNVRRKFRHANIVVAELDGAALGEKIHGADQVYLERGTELAWRKSRWCWKKTARVFANGAQLVQFLGDDIPGTEF